ncbi:nucleotidyl transferase AbiEii/AbiGii toxin family protein [Lentisphaera marina]|nr:nucleotidyl transferase AbiEii/AbiGii toxin family protein [Lentisphaera marina]MDD7984604.1 nucleotidyl transferase AbiEii/AbiGii toxin family protein [Lentisphaera marina]
MGQHQFTETTGLYPEKLQAMVSLDITNSRMKDFYDVWMITTKFAYDEKILIEAITATFKRRETKFPEGIKSLTEYFYGNKTKQTQWKAFIRKNNIEPNDLSLKQVCVEIQTTLENTFEQINNKP